MIQLTRLQYEVACMAAAFVSRPEIARRRGITIHTVDTMLTRIYKKLGVATRRELAPALVQRCEVGAVVRRGGEESHFGYKRGDALVITGGAYAGRSAEYFSTANARQLRVRVNGAVLCICRKYLRRPTEQDQQSHQAGCAG